MSAEASFAAGHNVKRGKEIRRQKEQEKQAYFAQTRERMGPLLSCSLSVRNLRKVPLPLPEHSANDTATSPQKAAAVLRIERHMNALEDPTTDPVGPATHLGIAAIEEHPRFKYVGRVTC